MSPNPDPEPCKRASEGSARDGPPICTILTAKTGILTLTLRKGWSCFAFFCIILYVIGSKDKMCM